MSNYTIEYFSWCKQDTHDKVWGYATIGYDNTLYNFYGKRGKPYTFKRDRSRWELERVAREKAQPGRKSGTYFEVPVAGIETIVPGFHEEFETQLAMAKLFDKFHGEKQDDGSG